MTSAPSRELSVLAGQQRERARRICLAFSGHPGCSLQVKMTSEKETGERLETAFV